MSGRVQDCTGKLIAQPNAKSVHGAMSSSVALDQNPRHAIHARLFCAQHTDSGVLRSRHSARGGQRFAWQAAVVDRGIHRGLRQSGTRRAANSDCGGRQPDPDAAQRRPGAANTARTAPGLVAAVQRWRLPGAPRRRRDGVDSRVDNAPQEPASTTGTSSPTRSSTERPASACRRAARRRTRRSASRSRSSTIATR